MKRRHFVVSLALALTLLLLSFAVSAQQPRAVPANDNLASATPIKIGKNYSVPDLAAATNEVGEAVASCRAAGTVIPNSVWFRFSQPVYSVVSLSTFGSVLATANYTTFDTVLAVYEETSPGVFTERACSDDVNGIAAARVEFVAAPGITYYIAAGTFFDDAFGPDSTLKLITRMLSSNVYLPNFSFETPVNGTDWQLKNGGDDQRECSNLVYSAINGVCTFHFTATPGITSKLTQTAAFSTAFVPRKNAFLTNGFYFRVLDVPLGAAKARFITRYSDGTPPSIQTFDLTGLPATAGYSLRQSAQVLKSKKVASIKFEVKFAASTGGLLVDFVTNVYTADPSTRDGLLPVPPAAK